MISKQANATGADSLTGSRRKAVTRAPLAGQKDTLPRLSLHSRREAATSTAKVAVSAIAVRQPLGRSAALGMDNLGCNVHACQFQGQFYIKLI